MKRERFPLTLPLLPDYRWRGSLTVLGRARQNDEDGFLVAFNAENPASETERYIYDRTVLTAKQLEDWTGWRDA